MIDIIRINVHVLKLIIKPHQHAQQNCLKWPLKYRQNKELSDKWQSNEDQKYCWLLPLYLAIVSLENQFLSSI